MRNSFKLRVYFKRGAILVFDFTKEEYVTEFINNNSSKIKKCYLIDESGNEILN